jgi:hypothetical protein
MGVRHVAPAILAGDRDGHLHFLAFEEPAR